MKIFARSSLLTLFVCLSSSGIAGQPVIEPQDLLRLQGNWEGSLTYVDYQSGQSYSMPAMLTVKAIEGSLDLALGFVYPNETSANSDDRLVVSTDRRQLNGHPIITRTEGEMDRLEISTEHAGRDGNENRKALLRNTYLVTPQKLVIQKHVRFEGTEEWFKRSEFNFQKAR